MRLAGTGHGLIPAYGSTTLRFIFTPLEAKLYMLDLPVKLAGGQVEHICIRAEGQEAAALEAARVAAAEAAAAAAGRPDSSPAIPVYPTARDSSWRASIPGALAKISHMVGSHTP